MKSIYTTSSSSPINIATALQHMPTDVLDKSINDIVITNESVEKAIKQITYLLAYPVLPPLCGLGLHQQCPKPLTVSRLRLPVRYLGFHGGRLHAILPPQFGTTTPPCPCGRPKQTLRAGSSVSMRTTWPVHRSLASLIRCTTVRSPYISYSSSL